MKKGAMNKLSRERRAQLLGMMVEGNSIRAIVRMTGVSKNTVTKLLEDAGEALFYHDQYVRGVAAKRVQCDEIWSFAGCKQKNVAKAKRKDLAYGDVWTWVAMDCRYETGDQLFGRRSGLRLRNGVDGRSALGAS